jgi:hypothetical protein
LAVIEQGLKVFSTIQKRCHRSLKRELKKIFILNGANLDEKIYFAVQDSTSREFKTMESGRDDFVSLIEVIPASDPNITSKAERLLKAQQILQSIRQSPLTGENKLAIYHAEREYYEALGATNIDLFLKEPEPEQPKDIPPIEENAMFMKEQSVPALPSQNHFEHYKLHEAFIMSPMWSTYITPLGKKSCEMNMREHLAFAYEQEAKMKQQMAQRQMMTPQGGMNGQVGTGGNPGMVGEQSDSPILDEFRESPEGQVGSMGQDERPYSRVGSQG